MVKHEMSYRAGRAGFVDVGLPDVDPHWRCSCGASWTFPAKLMPQRRTGDNRIEASRAHAYHAGAGR